MSKVDEYRPSFNALDVMKNAVDRELRRKKALGQYAIVVENHKPKKLDFSVLKSN